MLRRMAQGFAKVLQRTESPRQIQERKDLYMALLASTYKELRASAEGRIDTTTTTTTILRRRPRHELASLVEQAEEMLEDENVHQMTILELRRYVQSGLAPDTKHIFRAFHDAGTALRTTDTQRHYQQQQQQHGDSVLQQKMRHRRTKDEATMQSLLLRDYDDLSYHLACADNEDGEDDDGDEKESNAERAAASRQFHITKLGALKTVLDSQRWIPPHASDHRQHERPSPHHHNNNGSGPDHLQHHPSSTDDFGYGIRTNNPVTDRGENDDDAVRQIMQYNQLVNLSYAVLVKRQLGYATVSLRSTLPDAGRGIFVDGFAPAGSVVAFFPGEVWPKEFLQTTAIASHFQDDDNFQLSIRYDDILVDSRNSPCVVLDHHTGGNVGSNPWAVGHLANHAPPNCRPLPLNYTTEMGLERELRRFVPNSYARTPPLLGNNAAFEREDVYLHGMVLVTMRDVENEELFYDYRLNEDVAGAASPDWYQACDEEESRNRWLRDSK